MALFELIIALLFIGAVLSAWARQFNLPYPALLALAGTAIALLPNVPSVTLDPQLALTLFVAPVLLDAAFDTSLRDLRQYWRPVAALALGAVGLTIVAVALVTRWLMPQISWPVAIALGAIVAPPDAAAATAVLRQLRLPHRILVILEGESLLNDASALLTYRLAVGAAMTGAFGGWHAIPTLLLVTVGSIVLALVLSRLAMRSIAKIQDIATSVIIQFLSTFAVWMLAERLGLSGIITVVVYAILIARSSASTMPARLRIPSYAVWEVAVFILNVLAFILVGLQLKPILERLNETALLTYGATAAAICATVIVVRIVWVMGYYLSGPRLGGPSEPKPTWQGSALIAWCGMRGIVTLAAALALPDTFPHRDLALFAAFAVVLGTLVVQGLTLKPLLGLLKLKDDGSVDREVWLARARTARAAHDAVTAAQLGETGALLRRKYESRARHAEHVADTGMHDPADDANARELLAIRRDAQSAERRVLVDLRARGVIGDDAFHQVEEELDWADLDLDGIERNG